MCISAWDKSEKKDGFLAMTMTRFRILIIFFFFFFLMHQYCNGRLLIHLSASLHYYFYLLPRLQVAFLGVIGRYGVQTSIFVQSFGTVSFIMNIMSDLLQILEV